MRAAACCLLLAAACAARRPAAEATPRPVVVRALGQTVRLEYGPDDRRDAEELAALVPAALARLAPWGALREPVTVVLHPSHAAFAAAIDEAGADWLRAWTRYDRIDLQAPRTWRLLGRPGKAELLELLAHELAHCLLYQRAGTAATWRAQRLPLWLREGLASVAAGQGRWREGPDALRRFYLSGPASALDGDGAPDRAGEPAPERRGDPLSDPAPLYGSDPDLVYAAAHWAFAFLVDRYGMARLDALLDRLHAGRPFDAAFLAAMGISRADFEADFRRYVVWCGWEGTPRRGG